MNRDGDGRAWRWCCFSAAAPAGRLVWRWTLRAIWSQPIAKPQAIGLAQSVALHRSRRARRVVALSAAPGGALAVAAARRPAATSSPPPPRPTGTQLYVLTAGHRATLGDAIARRARRA